MRENLSLLSFWGLVFSLIAATFFVVVYAYNKHVNTVGPKNIVDELRRCAVAIYLAGEKSEAGDISKKLRAAADEIDRLRTNTSVLFWLIITMNAVVTSIFALAYLFL
jgi:hypothetical protein